MQLLVFVVGRPAGRLLALAHMHCIVASICTKSVRPFMCQLPTAGPSAGRNKRLGCTHVHMALFLCPQRAFSMRKTHPLRWLASWVSLLSIKPTRPSRSQQASPSLTPSPGSASPTQRFHCEGPHMFVHAFPSTLHCTALRYATLHRHMSTSPPSPPSRHTTRAHLAWTPLPCICP
ncbi:hypothetical protein BS50DRAFT_61776 [Corynespora cassiicola Philippines]|uniref:Uncharacterized protein n=1 Tax=Corynespora cassiicola Philippines TaxID=1448308 RepID=A0A2T2NJF0_CORCC|nr:hypothetical protein BS50DRAFT_61776 [Corynespora cassiicola Philippines]